MRCLGYIKNMINDIKDCMSLKTRRYWKMRKKILNWNFKIKKLIYDCDNRRQSNKEYKSFKKNIFSGFISGLFKGFVFAIPFRLLDIALLKMCEVPALDNNIFADVIIGELGVSGVILGLYCSNISSVYSTRYANAPEKIAIAFQYDRLTVKCMSAIIGFIIYGTIILIGLLRGSNVGWVSGGALMVWSLVVVISYGIAGNRTYQLSDTFKVSDDAVIILNRVITKNLNRNFYATDINYQNYFFKIAMEKIELLGEIQKYSCNTKFEDNASMLNFMCGNLGLLEQYWMTKRNISKDSLWFRRKGKYQKWHFANDSAASMALRTGTELRPKEEPEYYWFEDEIMSINHACVNYLVEKEDFEILYRYFAVFASVCKTAIVNKEANYYVGQINWLKNVIQKIVNEKNVSENIAFAGIIEHISLLYLAIILEAGKYYQNLDIDGIYKSVIDGIDTGKPYNAIKEIRGRDNAEIYKRILVEVYAEGHRITPDWLVKQYVAKEEYIYVNLLFDMVKEGIEHAYSLSTFFLEKKMNYEACILLTRFYEYESKLLNFYKYARRIEMELKRCHLDLEDKWDGSRLGGIEKTFVKYKKNLPEMLAKCSSEFAIKNWNSREDYPDFLGECYNHISEDTIEAIVKKDKEQFERDFENLTKIMLLYQEYIRSDFVKNKDLYRIEYAYYMFTSPIVEWAQIGGLGILWGEFFNDNQWGIIVKTASSSIFKEKEECEKSTELAEQLIQYVAQRDKFMYGIGSRDILETSWNQYVANAIRESRKIETEYVRFEQKIKTDSKLINAFCPDFLNDGFTSDPSEVFWVVCVNPLLSNEKKFHTRFSWEDDLNA